MSKKIMLDGMLYGTSISIRISISMLDGTLDGVPA
jgi:hypothetical protein